MVVRRLLRAALAVAVVVTGLGALAGPAGAATDLHVEAGYGGRFVPGKPVPVRVTITADRLLRGTLDFSLGRNQPGAATMSVPVEVPGGSVKQVVTVLTAPANADQATVNVALHAGSGNDASAQATLDFRDDEELVGLLPAVTPSTMPGTTPLVVDAGTASFSALDDALLADAPGSLAPLGTIVAGSDELAGLGADARRGLLAWVEEGGRLLVDAPLGTSVAGLPDEWQPGQSGRVTAGGGEIRLTAGAAAAGRWSEIIEPTPTISPNQKSGNGSIFFAPFGVADSVARDAGLQVAKLGWLLGFLLVYLVVVGPIVYAVLRRLHRPDAAWLLIPAVALVFTGVSYVAGSGLRSGTHDAHGSVILAGPGGAVERSWVGFVSRNGGDGAVSFPAGWSAGGVDTTFTGGTTSDVAVAEAGDQVVGRVRLDAGQFGIVGGEGATPMEGTLVVTAVATEDGTATGTVRNTTEYPMDEVAVFLGHATARVGSLAPGEQKEWKIDESRQVDAFTAPESVAWPAESGFNGSPDDAGPVSLAVWQQEVQRPGADYHTTGTAVAVGWTTDAASAAEAGGHAVTRGRTAVVGRAPVVAEGTWGSLGVRRDLLRSPADSAAAANGVPLVQAVYRFVLPTSAAVDTNALAFSVPQSVGRVEVWIDGKWTAIDDDVATNGPSNGDPSITRPVAIPPAAVHGGVVYARVQIRLDIGPMAADAFEIRHAAAS